MSGTHFHHLLPDPALQGVIDSYWIIRMPNVPEAVLPMVPMGYPILEFNLNDNWLIRGRRDGADRYRHLVIGLCARPWYYRNSGPLQSVLVRLQPWGLSTLFAGAARVNGPLDADFIFRGQQDLLVDQLRTENRPVVCKTYLDAFFLKFLRHSDRVPDERLARAMQQILRSRGNLSIAALEKMLFLSQRRLEQLFKEHIGLSPKKYADIARFQSVLADAEQNSSLTQIALDAGYYDQSHFIRHFRKFTDGPPSAMLRSEMVGTEKISNLYNSVF